MNQRRDDDENLVSGALGAYSIGGPALAGAYVLGGILQEAPKDRDLGPAPIGSDPWLLREVESAIAKDNPAHVKLVTVSVLEAVVTIRCIGTSEQAGLIERAARTIQGIKKLVMNVEPQTP